jgi:hypothetical protein
MSRYFSFFIPLLGVIHLLMLSSCMMHHLEVQTQFITKESLASYHVLTPDPQLDHPTIGQRLLVQWKFRASEVSGLPLTLHLAIRFRNNEKEELTMPIDTNCKLFVGGSYLYELVNEDYFKTGGILTYLAEVKSNDEVIACWRHPLWTELIEF